MLNSYLQRFPLEVDDVDVSVDGNEDMPWAAGVVAGSSVGAAGRYAARLNHIHYSSS